MTAPDAVREQYEALPYAPRDPAQELKQLRATLPAELKLVRNVLWGGQDRIRPGFRALDAGCGTGDSAIFLAEQLRHSGGNVVGFDLSEASLAIASERAQRRGLENVEFIRGRIEELPRLGLRPFDYIVSVGVLHHLPDPDAGLAALRDVLAPDGGLALMVYALYGRTAIYQLQELFQRIAPPTLPTEERLRIVKRTLQGLSSEHWASLGRSSYSGEVKLHGDAGLFDLFLHAQDRAYSVPQLYDWMDGAGLAVVRFDMPVLYEPSTNLPGIDVDGRDGRSRHAIAELLNGRMKKHTVFATHTNSALPEGPAWDDESAVPHWLIHDHAWALEQVERRPHLAIFYEGAEFQCALDGFRRDFLRLIDGTRTLGDILAALEPRHGRNGRHELVARWKLLLEALAMFNVIGLLRP